MSADQAMKSSSSKIAFPGATLAPSLMTVTAVILLANTTQITATGLFALLVLVLGLPLAIVDAKNRELPDPLIGAMLLGVLTICLIQWQGGLIWGVDSLGLIGYLVGAGIYTGLFIVLLFVADMGAGDVKLSIPLGAMLGHLGLQAIVLGILIPYALAIPHAIINKRRGERHLPFGPYMLAGALAPITLTLIGAMP